MNIDIYTIALTVIGLVVFEVVSSIDNAVVNADVLASMKNKVAKRFFITWGIFIAVFVVRGILPSLIVFASNPSIGVFGAFSAIWSNNTSVQTAIESSAPLLLMAGGMFLLLLWTHWICMEDKEFGLPLEDKIQVYGAVWFYAIASILLVSILVLINKVIYINPMYLALAASIGFGAFFVTDGFKENAVHIEERLLASGTDSGMSDWAKVVFLEIIDLTFSIDGVIGAFAFTMSVPLILLGNGIGALIVRHITISNIDKIRSYKYLKNGAMYSIGFLGIVMILEAFGAHIPFWLSPVVTLSLISYFFLKSIRANNLCAG